MNIFESVKCIGRVKCTCDYNDGRREELWDLSNTILHTGRIALAMGLANEIGDQFSFYVARMVFGSGGTNGGVPKYVDSGRNGLFGLTVLTKPVISTLNPNNPTEVNFTSIVRFDDINNTVINEMALQMNNGQLYSMRTFPDLTKTSEMQLTFNWSINYI